MSKVTFQQSDVMKTAPDAVLCLFSRDTVHSGISPAKKKHETNAYPVGPLAQYIRDLLSVVPPHVLCGFYENLQTRNTRVEKVQFLADKKHTKL